MSLKEEVKSMEELFEKHLKTLRTMCQELGVKRSQKVLSLYYESVVLAEVNVSRKGKTYRYVELRGFKGRKGESLRLFKSPPPVAGAFVNLYRFLKHFRTAMEYFYPLLTQLRDS